MRMTSTEKYDEFVVAAQRPNEAFRLSAIGAAYILVI